MCNDTYVALGGGPVDAAAEAIVGLCLLCGVLWLWWAWSWIEKCYGGAASELRAVSFLPHPILTSLRVLLPVSRAASLHHSLIISTVWRLYNIILYLLTECYSY